MAAVQKSRNNKCSRECGEKGTLLDCWWECKLVQPLWRTVWRFLKELEIEMSYHLAIWIEDRKYYLWLEHSWFQEVRDLKKKEASAYYLPGLWLKSFELLNTVPGIDGFSWFTVVGNFIAAFLKYAHLEWVILVSCFCVICCCCCAVTKSCLTFCDLHELQHTRLPSPSLSPGECSNSCPLSQWCHPTVSSSVVPFSSHLQSFPASGSFPINQFFASVAKVLELQLQHQSFQWIFRTDFLRIDWLDLLAV